MCINIVKPGLDRRMDLKYQIFEHVCIIQFDVKLE